MFLFEKKNIYILALDVASPLQGTHQHCAICIGTLSFPMPTLVSQPSADLLTSGQRVIKRKVFGEKSKREDQLVSV